MKVDNIRNEIQEWLELVTRTVKGIPFDQKVEWGDIEEVYNSSWHEERPTYKAHNEELEFESVYTDAISIDHLSSEVLSDDFATVLELIKRYRGIVISENINHKNK